MDCIHFVRVTFMVVLLLAAKPSVGATADAAFREGYRAMVLDFCTATVASNDPGTIQKTAQAARILVSEPHKLTSHPWKERIKGMLGLADDEPVYSIKLPESAPGKFVLGYLPIDGRSCAVFAQDLDGIRAAMLEEIEREDSGWVLNARTDLVRAYLRNGVANGHSLLLITRDPEPGSGVEFSAITRYEGEVRTPTAEARAAFLEKFLSTCIEAAHRGTPPTFADFNDFFTLTTENQTVSARSLPQYPSATLLLNGEKGRTCGLIGGYSLTEAEATRAEIERQLTALNAVPIDRVRNVEGSGRLIAKPTDAPRDGGDAFIKIDKLMKDSVFFINIYRARR